MQRSCATPIAPKSAEYIGNKGDRAGKGAKKARETDEAGPPAAGGGNRERLRGVSWRNDSTEVQKLKV